MAEGVLGRGTTVTVRVTDPGAVETGVASVAVDGQPLDLPADDKRGALVQVDAPNDGTVLDVVMG